MSARLAGCGQTLRRLLLGPVLVVAFGAQATTAAKSRSAQAQARRAALAEGAADTHSSVRRGTSLLLAKDDSAHGIVLLYLLAHDADSGVQQSALAATLRRCTHETPSVCAGMMRFFVGEQSDLGNDNETLWAARDWLLLDDPQSATQNATLDYKLDVVARMAQQATQPDAAFGALRILRLLSEDPEAEVQQAAAAVLLRAKL